MVALAQKLKAVVLGRKERAPARGMVMASAYCAKATQTVRNAGSRGARFAAPPEPEVDLTLDLDLTGVDLPQGESQTSLEPASDVETTELPTAERSEEPDTAEHAETEPEVEPEPDAPSDEEFACEGAAEANEDEDVEASDEPTQAAAEANSHHDADTIPEMPAFLSS